MEGVFFNQEFEHVMIEPDGRCRKFRVWYDGFWHQESGNFCTFLRGSKEVELTAVIIRSTQVEIIRK